MIACRDVSFSYPASGPVDGECLTEGALKHITCTIEDGSFVLLCGASGCGKTTFVMFQGLVGAFFVRIPVSYLASKRLPVTLIKIGLATPCSTFVRIILCVLCFLWLGRKEKKLAPVHS